MVVGSIPTDGATVVVGNFAPLFWGDEREEWKKLVARVGGLEVYAMPVYRKVFCALLTVRGRNL